MLGYLVTALPHIVAILSLVFLTKALIECFKGKVPSAPAAIGRALGIIVLGQLTCFYLLWYIFSFLLSFINIAVKDSTIALFHGPIGIIFILAAGILAVSTFEDTQSMNLKIVVVIGLLIQGLITAFNFNEGVSTNIALYLLIPLIFIGGYIGKRTPNKSLK